MRKVLLLLSLAFVSITILAGNVSEKEALQKAQNFMQGKMFKQKKLRRAPSKGVKDNAFYVFNVENKGGFVIVSGDDRTAEILGYADKGELNVETAPCNLKWLLSCYEKTIDSLRQIKDTGNGSSRRTVSARRAARTEIAPLITTHWGQGAPYNNMCPEIDGQRCLTGCVATAMAQIINFHQWPQGNTAAMDAYTTASYGVNVPALEASSFDWGNMRDEYHDVQTTAEENSAVAKLMRYCGQAVNMDYGISASGAEGWVADPLKEVFGFSKSTFEFLGTKLSAEHLEELVYRELMESRPVFYTGSNSTLGGHAFVVDGYNNDGTFHINWGWNGDDDGYFVITGLTEDIMPFPFARWNTKLTIGIEPPAQNIPDSKITANYLTFSPRSIYRGTISEDFIQSVSFNHGFTADYHNVNYDVGLGLYDMNGQLIKVLYHEIMTFPLNETIIKNITFTSDIPLGDYNLMPIYRYNESQGWKLASYYVHLIVHIKERSLIFENFNDDANGDYEEYGVVEVDGVTYKLYSEFGNKRANILPYQITGEYSGNVVIPNEIEYNGEKYNVFRDESAFDIFYNNDVIESLTSGAEGGINRIQSCSNLSEINFTYGHDVEIQGCHAVEHLDLPATMHYPNIRYCNGLKTMRFRCKSINWGNTTVDWGDEFLPALTDVYFYTPTPPPVGGYYVIENGHWVTDKSCDIPANSHATLHVPVGAKANYLSSRWKQWNIVDDVETETYVTWGYCHSDAVSNSGMAISLGNNNSECAMRVLPEELEKYKGCKITHIQVYSTPIVTNEFWGNSYEYVFITKPGVDYLVKQPFTIVRGIWNTIELDEPYTITGDELFVGMGKRGGLEVSFSDETYVLNANWARAMGDDNANGKVGVWHLPCPKDLAHPLPLRFVIQGENIPKGIVLRETKINGIDDASARAYYDDVTCDNSRRTASNVNMQGIIRNRSLDVIDSYTVTYSIDGGEPQTKEINTTLLPNATEQIVIDLPESLNDGKNHTISTDVTTVNSAANGLMNLNMPIVDIVKLLGDVNGDNSVSVSDVINTISHVLKNTPTMFVRSAAQMNDDDEISVTDVIGLINMALGGNLSRQDNNTNHEVE